VTGCCSGRMLSPSSPGLKRHATDMEPDSEAMSTRKAPRHAGLTAATPVAGTAAVGFDAHLSMLTSGVDGIAGLDATQLTIEQCQLLQAACNRLDSVIARAETARNTPDEQLLPMDILVHMLSFLPADDLRAAGLACCHFDGAVRSAASSRLTSTYGEGVLRGHRGYFEVPLLWKLEKQTALVPKLVKKLKPSMKDLDDECAAAAAEIFEELKAFEGHAVASAIAANVGLVPRKLAALPGRTLKELRSKLFQLMYHKANDALKSFPNKEQGETALKDLANACAQEMRKGEACAFDAWQLMVDMPPALIEAHLDVIMPHLTARSIFNHMAIAAIDELPDAALGRSYSELEPLLQKMVQQPRTREEGKDIARILSRVRQQASN